MKKIILSLGTIAVTIVPIALTISCGSKEKTSEEAKVKVKAEQTQMLENKINITEKLYTQDEFKAWNLDKKIVYSTGEKGNIKWSLGHLFNKKIINPNLMFITNENFNYTNDFKIKLIVWHMTNFLDFSKDEKINAPEYAKTAVEILKKNSIKASGIQKRIMENTQNIKGFVLMSWDSLPKNTFIRKGVANLLPDKEDIKKNSQNIEKFLNTWNKTYDNEIKKIETL